MLNGTQILSILQKPHHAVSFWSKKSPAPVLACRTVMLSDFTIQHRIRQSNLIKRKVRCKVRRA
jgi:hypothetical protein